MDIKDRRVLVIGASSGVGRDIGESLAAGGARVAFAARRGELVEEAAQAAGDRCIGLACDVREDASCDDVVADAAEALGGLDTLVYAAAVGILTPLVDSVLLVVRSGVTSKPAIHDAVATIDGSKLLGLVLNDAA